MGTRFFWIAAALLLLIAGRGIAEAQPLTMALVDGRLQGDGAEALRAELPGAQFILFGEDHGFADSPELALALAREARPFGVVHHVMEVGPNTDTLLTEALHTGDESAVAALMTGRPLAFPFASLAEDARLADYFVDQAEDGIDPLWGIDQEFVGAPLIFLDTLVRLAPDADAAKLAGDLLTKEQAAFANGDLGGILLMTAEETDFEALRTAFAASGEAMQHINSLAESTEIYRLYNSGANYASNAARVALLRRQFLENYRAAPGPAPRVLFKMGAGHLARGTGQLNTFDLGSLTEGLAAANGLDVVRILFLPLEGHVTSLNPAAADVFVQAEYRSDDVAALLKAAGLAEDAVPSEGYAVIALEPIRLKLEQKGLNALSADQRFFLLGYDYLVTTRGARAATPLPH